MSEAMLEKAARAAYESWIDDVRDLEPSWSDLPESHRDRLIQSARAVLMAVREPDGEVIKAGQLFHGSDEMPEMNFTAMIDAILAQEPGA